MEIPFVGGAYTGRSKNLNAQVCQNYYPVLDKQGGKKVIALMGTPGLNTAVYASGLSYRVRGLLSDEKNGTLYIVIGDKIRRLDSAYSATNMTGDDLGTTTGKVWMESNGTEIMIIDGVKGYIVTIATGVCAEITDGDFPTPSSLTYQDGYFIVTKSGTDEIYISALYDGVNWAALDYAAAESSPDTARCVYSNRRNLWIPGQKTSEVFYNSGDVDFPFERVAGAVLNVGIRSPAGITSLGSTVYWLDNNGQARRSVGYESQVISTPQIDFKIAEMSDISDCECYATVLEGEESVIFQFPTADETLVYSPTSGFWHTRTTGTYDTRHPIGSYALFVDDRVVGHISDGNLYKYDLETYNDPDSTDLNAIRAGQYVHADRKRIFHDEVDIELETGYEPTARDITEITYPHISADDAYFTNAPSFSATALQMFIGMAANGTTTYGALILFRGLNIPNEQEIISTKLKLYSLNARSGATCNLKIYLQDADTGVAPTTHAEMLALSLTSGESWSSVAAISAAAWYWSEDFTDELQEIIDRPGWAQGNDLLVVIKDNSSSAGAFREFVSIDYIETATMKRYVPELHIKMDEGDLIAQARLTYSDDFGNSWSTERWRSMGTEREFNTKCKWQKLGSSRDRIYKLKISDPVKRVILGANLKASIGRY